MGSGGKTVTPSGRLRIFLVDDHDLVLEGLRSIICAEPDMEVVGSARNGKGLVEKVFAARTDVVLLDIQIADFDVFELIAEIQETSKRDYQGRIPNIMLVTGYADAYIATRAHRVGVRGYLLKEDALSHSLPGAIRVVADGGVAFSGKVQDLLYSRDSLPGGLRLGGEQYNVLALMVKGYNPAQIARELNLSLNSVYTIQKRIRNKLKADSNSIAVGKAIMLKIVSLNMDE